MQNRNFLKIVYDFCGFFVERGAHSARAGYGTHTEHTQQWENLFGVNTMSSTMYLRRYCSMVQSMFGIAAHNTVLCASTTTEPYKYAEKHPKRFVSSVGSDTLYTTIYVGFVCCAHSSLSIETVKRQAVVSKISQLNNTNACIHVLNSY